MNINIEKDSRKWVLYNNLLTDFQNLYELYTSVETKKGSGSVTIENIDNSVGSNFIIKQTGYDISLEIEGEEERKRFLEYLVQNYFKNEEIDKWYLSKVAEKEKLKNHNIPLTHRLSEEIDFKIHRKETRYYKWRIFISGCFYLALAGFIVSSFMDSTSTGIFTAGVILGFILFFGFLKRIFQGFFIGLIKGACIKLNENQYPEVYKIVKDQSSLIGLKEVPDVYILCGHFNAFVTKFARKKFLVIFSEVLETASTGNFEVLKFVIGHEIGHLKRQHLNREIWLSPSSFIPFLKKAHSRGCEYTCDRIGYHFSQTGAMEGILILAAGKEIYSKINVNQYIADSNYESDFWVWFSEKFFSHPYTFKRMEAIKNYAERGY